VKQNYITRDLDLDLQLIQLISHQYRKNLTLTWIREYSWGSKLIRIQISI